MKQINDYLQTQALKYPREAVAVSRATTLAVIEHARAHIEPDVWLHDALPDHFRAQEFELKALFMALDSTFSRQTVQSAVIYAWLPEESRLIRVARIGTPIEDELPVNHDSATQFLPAKTALTAWANVADNIAHWLEMGELVGEHHRRSPCQVSLPIAGEDGAVYGVLHLENDRPLGESALAQWLGLALGVLPLMRELCPRAPNHLES